MKLNSKNVRDLSKEITEALEELGSKHDLVLKINGGSFDFSGAFATLKLEVSTISSDGEVKTKEAVAWEKRCHLYGFNPGQLGQKFRTWNGEYTICGLNPRARKYPVLAKDSKGRVYKLSASAVLNSLQKAEEV